MPCAVCEGAYARWHRRGGLCEGAYARWLMRGGLCEGAIFAHTNDGEPAFRPHKAMVIFAHLYLCKVLRNYKKSFPAFSLLAPAVSTVYVRRNPNKKRKRGKRHEQSKLSDGRCVRGLQ